MIGIVYSVCSRQIKWPIVCVCIVQSKDETVYDLVGHQVKLIHLKF